LYDITSFEMLLCNSGGGQQTRTITCLQTKNNGTTPVSNSLCSAQSAALPSSQVCNNQACAASDWAAANWGSCSKNCGTGTIPICL
jgi:hypothetical protein